MNILGGRVTSMAAKKLEENPTESINMNVDILSVTNESKILKVVYAAKISYEPKVAMVVVEGELIVDEDTEAKAKEAVESFKKNKRLPTELAEEVVTAVNYSATAVGTVAAFAVGLSAPINVPRVKIQEAPKGPAPKAS